MQRDRPDLEGSTPAQGGRTLHARRRPASMVVVDAVVALRAEATAWRLSPASRAQHRAQQLDRVADELRAALGRGALS